MEKDNEKARTGIFDHVNGGLSKVGDFTSRSVGGFMSFAEGKMNGVPLEKRKTVVLCVFVIGIVLVLASFFLYEVHGDRENSPAVLAGETVLEDSGYVSDEADDFRFK